MTTVAADPIGGTPPLVATQPMTASPTPWQLLAEAYHRTGSCLVISLLLVGDALARWGVTGRLVAFINQ